jgi:hypothetical protein
MLSVDYLRCMELTKSKDAILSGNLGVRPKHGQNRAVFLREGFIGTAKGYNAPRLAPKLKICFRPMPRVPVPG